MRKWTAIWMLAARAQGPWALAAILISTALVAAAFFLAAPEGVAAAGGVEATVADSACALASGLGLAALCAALALPLSDLFGTRPGLTLLRLRVGERAALLHIAGFDAACRRALRATPCSAFRWGSRRPASPPCCGAVASRSPCPCCCARRSSSFPRRWASGAGTSPSGAWRR